MGGCPIHAILGGVQIRAVAPISMLTLLFLWASSQAFLPSSSATWYLLWHGLLLHNTSWVLLRPKVGESVNFKTRIAFLVVLATIFQTLFPVIHPVFANYSYYPILLCLAMVDLIRKAIPWYLQLCKQVDRTTLSGNFTGKFRPTIYYGQTLHSRFTPVKHDFKYPLMYFGFPIEFEGTINSLVSVRGVNEGRERPYWGKGAQIWSFFDVDPTRYFNPHLPFSRKLDSFFLLHGIDKSSYTVYFVTTPSFLGYCFNPVSYYYLYNKVSNALEMVVLEVNNTFGEKHIYLVRHDNPGNPATRTGYLWCGVLDKKFHISPFGHRSGVYNIFVADPINEKLLFDIHMLLLHREGYKSMVANVRSTMSGLDVLTAGWREVLYTAVFWGFNQWLAIPRTMLEALLTFRKGAVVYTRPEVLKGSGGRSPSDAEREMTNLWMEYFEDRVQKYPHPLTVTIIMPQPHASRVPDIIDLQNDLALTGENTLTEQLQDNLTNDISTEHYAKQQLVSLLIHVNNPRFFRHFFTYQDPTQAVHLDILSQPYERQSAHITDMDLFLDVLLKSRPSDIADRCTLQPQNSLRWRLLSYWRRCFSQKLMVRRAFEMVAETQYTDSQKALAMDKGTGAHFYPLPPHETARFNTLDSHVATKGCSAISKYRRLCIEAFLVDIMAGGDVEAFQHAVIIWQFTLYLARLGVMVYLGISLPIFLARGDGMVNWSKFTVGFLFAAVNLGSVVEALCGIL